MFSHTDYDLKFIKQYFVFAYIVVSIFEENHSKIDTTVEGVEGAAGPPVPKVIRVILILKETKKIKSKRRHWCSAG